MLPTNHHTTHLRQHPAAGRKSMMLKPAFCSAISLALMAALAVQPQSLQAQWIGERSQFYNSYDLKHYALAPNEGKDEYVMAGTMFDYAGTVGNGAVHWLYFDNAGNTALAKIVDDPDYDERVVGTHMFNGNSVTIASRVGLTGGPNGLEIITLDMAGNFLSTNVVNSSDPGYPSMYPLSSLKYTDNELFICGYVTNGGSGALPDLSTLKEGFVLKYDIAAATVIDIHYFDSPVTGPYDFDMATRIKAVSQGLWVGGSVNRGPMMNRIIDPNTLNDIWAAHFGGTVSAPYLYESSFDIMEKPNGDMFVFGNLYAINGLPTPPFQPSPMPWFVHISGVRPNLNPYPGNNRWQFNGYDYAWGVNILKDKTSDDIIVLNGFESNRSCNTSPYTSMDNINPFLTKMKIDMTAAGINVVPFYWNTILSFNETGNMSLPNSYFQLGDYMSNNAWPPVSSVRDFSVSDDILLSAPVWNFSGRLNIKLVRTDDNGQMPNCKWAPACSISNVLTPTNTGGPQSNLPFSWNEYFVGMSSNDYFPDQIDDCTGQYRPTAIATAGPGTIQAAVYPNPATHDINLTWQYKGTAPEAVLRIVDVMGREVLLQALAQQSGANSTLLDISSLAPGVYHYTLNTNQSKATGTFVKK